MPIFVLTGWGCSAIQQLKHNQNSLIVHSLTWWSFTDEKQDSTSVNLSPGSVLSSLNRFICNCSNVKIFSLLISSPNSSRSQDKQFEGNSYCSVVFRKGGPSTTEMLHMLLWSLALCEPENRSTLHQKERIHRILCSQTATHTSDLFLSEPQREDTVADKPHAYF